MVLKSEIEKAVTQQREHLLKKEDGVKRALQDQITLNTESILIISGIRRCGKSTLMNQLIKKTKKNAYFNFEDPRIFDFEASDFVKLSEVLDENLNYYFFDEIQNIEKWEVFIRNLHDKQNIICITGSNASLLSKELGTRLTGRHIQMELFPFSYKESLLSD
jgi:predicted AAA+ superfamily ATPase